MGSGRKAALFIAGAGVVAAFLAVVSNTLPILSSTGEVDTAIRVQEKLDAKRREQQAADARALELQRESEAACIRHAIDEARSHASPTDPAVTAAAFRQIDLAGCPADFVDQAVRYVQAIEQAAGVLVELKRIERRLGGAILSGVFGNQDPLNDLQQRGDELKQRYEVIEADHLKAAQEMERIAARYGIQERISDPSY